MQSCKHANPTPLSSAHDSGRHRCSAVHRCCARRIGGNLLTATRRLRKSHAPGTFVPLASRDPCRCFWRRFWLFEHGVECFEPHAVPAGILHLADVTLGISWS
jgi:hypothetical protein